VSIKDVYQHPTVTSLATAVAPPPNPLEGALAEVVGVEQVSRAAHFFDDLGTDSMAMASFCARVRKRTDLPSVSVKEVYQHPTVRDLATALTREATPVGRCRRSRLRFRSAQAGGSHPSVRHATSGAEPCSS
jgi:hypothetical protein